MTSRNKNVHLATEWNRLGSVCLAMLLVFVAIINTCTADDIDYAGHGQNCSTKKPCLLVAGSCRNGKCQCDDQLEFAFTVTKRPTFQSFGTVCVRKVTKPCLEMGVECAPGSECRDGRCQCIKQKVDQGWGLSSRTYNYIQRGDLRSCVNEQVRGSKQSTSRGTRNGGMSGIWASLTISLFKLLV